MGTCVYFCVTSVNTKDFIMLYYYISINYLNFYTRNINFIYDNYIIYNVAQLD